jgi:hypothetical protein
MCILRDYTSPAGNNFSSEDLTRGPGSIPILFIELATIVSNVLYPSFKFRYVLAELQAGRSRVGYPIGSWDFSIYLILPTAVWLWV